jgi:hypothetical protein
VIGELIARSELSHDDVGEMYRLFRTHFERVSEQRFREDLDEKHWVVRIRDRTTLHGFSSLRFMRTGSGASGLNVLYSGDTIVAPEARGTTVLARTWINGVRRLSDYYGTSELYWLLLVSGFRTYRLLPLFWKQFFPNWSEATPSSVRAGVDSLAGSMFGNCYDPRAGIVRFANPQPLRPELSHIPEHRLADSHVKFFAAANPGHAKGDELVCWTRLSYDNLTEAGKRMWHASDGASAHLEAAATAATADLA